MNINWWCIVFTVLIFYWGILCVYTVIRHVSFICTGALGQEHPPLPSFTHGIVDFPFDEIPFICRLGGGYISRLFSISYRIKGIYVKKKNQLLCGSKSGNWVPVLKPCDLYPIGIKKKAGAFYFLYSFKMYMF